MAPGDRGELPVGAVEAHDADLARLFVAQRHVHVCAVAPESEERPVRCAEKTDCSEPGFRRHDGTRPRMMVRHQTPLSHQFADPGYFTHRLPQLPGHVLKPGHQQWRQIEACAEHQRQVRVERHVGRLGRLRTAQRIAEGDAVEAQQ